MLVVNILNPEYFRNIFKSIILVSLILNRVYYSEMSIKYRISNVLNNWKLILVR